MCSHYHKPMFVYTQCVCTCTCTHYKILLLQQITQTSLFIKGQKCVLNREGITTLTALVDDTVTYSIDQ